MRRMWVLTLGVLLGVARVAPAAAGLTVESIDPPRPASGQVVLILVERDVAATDLSLLIEQNGHASEAFVFPAATLPDAIFARLPAGLEAGSANLLFTDGAAVVGDAFEFEVGEAAAPPEVWGVYRYAVDDTWLGAVTAADTLESVTPGERLVVFGAGMDTTGATLILRHAGGTDELHPAFGHQSTSMGVAPVFDLPADLPAGPAHLSVRIRVCDQVEACNLATYSGESDAIDLLVD